jgi:hypothetical protein
MQVKVVTNHSKLSKVFNFNIISFRFGVDLLEQLFKRCSKKRLPPQTFFILIINSVLL